MVWTRMLADARQLVEGKTGIYVVGCVDRYFPTDTKPKFGLQNFLAKLDFSGNVLFVTYFGDPTGFQNPKLVLDSSDNCLITRVGGAGNWEQLRPRLFKYSSQGTKLWVTTIPDEHLAVSDVQFDAASNLYVVGTSGASYTTAGYAAKIGASGSILWQRTLTDADHSYRARSCRLCSDGSLLTDYGYSAYDSSGAGTRLQKTSSSGAVIWDRNFAEPFALSFLDQMDNAYLYALHLGVRKVDASGATLWTNAALKAAFGSDLAGNLMMQGYTYGPIVNTIGKFTPDGILLWSRDLPAPEDAAPFLICPSGDGFLSLCEAPQYLPFLRKRGGTGNDLWTYQAFASDHTGASDLGTATTSAGTSFLQYPHHFAAFDSAGKLKWEIPGTGRLLLPTPAEGFLVATSAGIRQYDANGNVQWDRTLSKYPEQSLVDSSGNVYCFDGLLKKFSPTGALLWSLDLGAGSNFSVEPWPPRQTLWMNLDPSGNVLAVRDNVDYYLWKVSPSGTVQWKVVQPKSYSTDVPVKMLGDGSGNSYLATAAYSQGTTVGHIAKISAAGVPSWETDLLFGDNFFLRDILFYKGKLYAAGRTRYSNADMFGAFCVDSNSGSIDWARPFNPGAYSQARFIHVDKGLDSLILAGYAYSEGTSTDYALVGLDLSGNVTRVSTFDSGFGIPDVIASSGIDAQNNFYVYGVAMGPSWTWDYHIAKYSFPPPDWASIEIPTVVTKMAAGTSYSGTVKVTNTGLNTWTAAAGYKLDCVQGSTWSLTSVPLASGDSIAPGQSKVFSFTVTAPATPGAYPLTFKMEHSGVQFDNASASLGIQVMTQTNFGQFVGQTVPTAMVAGQSYAVSVQYKNTGSNTWTPGNGYKLQSVNPLNNTRWGVNRLALTTSSVAPGATGTFSGTVIAPMTSGTYNFQWQPIQDTTGLAFGSPSTNVDVTVTNAGDAARYVSKTGPLTVNAGTDFYVQDTMLNVGSNTWSTSAGYSLRAIFNNWGAMNIFLPGSVASVAPGSQVTFTKLLTAPLTPGTYPMQWQMLHGSTLFGDKTPYLNISVVQGPYNAKFNSQSVLSTSVAAGTTFGCTFSMQNLGTSTWDSSVKLASIGSSFGVTSLPVSGMVIQNANTSFTGTFTAPATPGTYTFQFRMQSPAGTYFGQPSTPVTIVVTPADAAQFISKTGPLTVNAGSDFYVQNTFKNTGTSTWSSASGFNLRSINPTDNLTWGRNRIYLPGTGSVAPGGSVTLTGLCTAPSQPGTYTMQWQMNHGSTLFGEKTPALTLNVVQSADNAVFLTQTVVPTSVAAGSTFTVNIAMQNVGTATWGTGYSLVPIGSSAWGLSPLPSGAVPPGGQQTFTANCTAPATPGTYTFQMRMDHSGTKFGQATRLVTITVT